MYKQDYYAVQIYSIIILFAEENNESITWMTTNNTPFSICFIRLARYHGRHSIQEWLMQNGMTGKNRYDFYQWHTLFSVQTLKDFLTMKMKLIYRHSRRHDKNTDKLTIKERSKLPDFICIRQRQTWIGTSHSAKNARVRYERKKFAYTGMSWQII